ncbi:MAG TPA: hypothetical protein VGF49_11420 [Candidatus Solibacter sp.]
MRVSRRFARCVLFSFALAASAVMLQAQEEKEPPKKRNTENKAEPKQQRTERKQEQAQPQQQRTERPPERQHTPPPDQQQQQPQHTAAPPVQRTPPANQPAQQAQPQRQDRPAQTPQVYQGQPNNQPGRTFGNPPGGQPGRTFGGNQPGRVAPSMEARPATPGLRTYTTRGGDVIHRDAGGAVRRVQMPNGTVVYHPPNAPRRVEVVRPGGRVVVASAPGHGYVQRQVVVSNTTIIKRTYIFNGVPQARIYRPRMYNGVSLVVYTPVRYYRPAFYAYAFNPWPRPIVFGWGWAGSPWYGYYGGYFTPYPVYASPSLWLTDYLIAATLENAYQERMAARAAAANSYADSGGPSAPLTPEVKQAIADEVRRQIDQERAQQQSSNAMATQDPNIFADNSPHVFVASTPIMVSSNYGDCAIGEGDVLQMNQPPLLNSPTAEVIVLASRGQDCRKGSRVNVGLQDLQEMHNQMLATIDRGMGDLQSKQGQGGVPPAPQGSTGTIDSAYAREAQPDANVASELTTVSQEADRAEQQAIGQAGDAQSPPTLTLGLSIEDVKAIQGEPEKVVDLGAKKIYVYKDLKITFQDGKVIDIQ